MKEITIKRDYMMMLTILSKKLLLNLIYILLFLSKNKISALSKAARFKPILENENNKLPPVGHYNTNKYTMFNTNSKNKGITIPKASLNNSKNIYTEENMYYYDKDNIAFKINNK